MMYWGGYRIIPAVFQLETYNLKYEETSDKSK